MTKLVAFLRGVNLGKRRMKMEDLRKSFARAGFDDAQTLLASGNVLFEGAEGAETVSKIETQLKADFGFDVETILRSIDDLQALVAAEPFADHPAGPDIKHYVYFLADRLDKDAVLPADVPGDFAIVGKTQSAFFVVAWRMENGRFGAGMDAIAKPFGHTITNRNWNTINRLIALSEKP